jgi:hypothetical protein
MPYVEDNTDDFGRSIAQSKLETKVRADFEITGAMRDWILIVRPFQKIVAEHAEQMVEQGVMTREESVHWLNMHWELICAQAKDVADGCCIAAYGRERQTRVVVSVKRQTFCGYERIRLKAETFLLPRAGATEEELDLDDLSVAGVSQRRAAAVSEGLLSPETAAEPPAVGGEEEEFIFGNIEVDDEEDTPARSRREWDVGEVWIKVEFDEGFYEAVLEVWGVLKEQKHEQHLAMAEEAVDIALEREGHETAREPDDSEEGEASPRGEQYGMAGVFRLREKKQGIHQRHAKNFMKGRSELEHPNPQGLIDQYAGTGDPKQVHRNGFIQREVVDCNKVIGYYFEKGSSVPKPTTRFMIHYSPKKNEAHIVPARPRADDEEDGD